MNLKASTNEWALQPTNVSRSTHTPEILGPIPCFPLPSTTADGSLASPYARVSDADKRGPSQAERLTALPRLGSVARPAGGRAFIAGGGDLLRFLPSPTRRRTIVGGLQLPLEP